MSSRYNIELNAREALVVRVELRKAMNRREATRNPDVAWKDVYATAADVIAKLENPANCCEVDDRPKTGLCGNREDHVEHVYESDSLGTFWCHADQTKRLPFAMGRKDK